LRGASAPDEIPSGGTLAVDTKHFKQHLNYQRERKLKHPR